MYDRQPKRNGKPEEATRNETVNCTTADVRKVPHQPNEPLRLVKVLLGDTQGQAVQGDGENGLDLLAGVVIRPSHVLPGAL
jgi:hypothetical protein